MSIDYSAPEAHSIIPHNHHFEGWDACLEGEKVRADSRILGIEPLVALRHD